MSENKSNKALSRNQLIDLLMRFLLAITFAFSAGVCFKSALSQLQAYNLNASDSHVLFRMISVLAIGLYTMMIACLYVLRIKPINTASGMLPCSAAILGGFLMSGLLLLSPNKDLSLPAQIFSCLLVIVGNFFAVVILLRLGRSFSILPQSRKLVTDGPYGVIRHPLYLAEAVATLGAFISFLSPWALLLVIVQIGLQIMRINFEERVLRETFPEYEAYAKKTYRLIPGIY